MREPLVPMLIEPTAQSLVQAALDLEEDADLLARSPTPDNWDALRRSIASMKATIANAERDWGL